MDVKNIIRNIAKRIIRSYRKLVSTSAIDRVIGRANTVVVFSAGMGAETTELNGIARRANHVIAVEENPARLEVIKKLYPKNWHYETKSPLRVCAEFSASGLNHADLVIGFSSRRTIDYFWEILLPYARLITEKHILFRISQNYLDDFARDVTVSSIETLARSLHGLDIKVISLIKTSDKDEGTYWVLLSVLNRHTTSIEEPMDKEDESKLLPHSIEVKDLFTKNDCRGTEECVSLINEFRASLDRSTRKPLQRIYPTDRFLSMPEKRVLSYEFAAAILNLERFDNIEEVMEAAKLTTGRKGRVNREVNRAKSLGFFVKRFSQETYVPDLYDIHMSKPVRGGTAIKESYRVTVEEMGGYPDKYYEFEAAECPVHYREFWGVFQPEPGRTLGSAQTDCRLVGYISFGRVGNFAQYSRIMGHGDYLKHGIMYLLHFSLIEHYLSIERHGLRYIMYGAFNSRGEDGGLRIWKQRCLFEPKYIRYDEAGDWFSPQGMQYLEIGQQ